MTSWLKQKKKTHLWLQQHKIYLVYKNLNVNQLTSDFVLTNLYLKREILSWMVCKVEHNNQTDFHVLLLYKKKIGVLKPKFFDLEFYGVYYKAIVKPVGSTKKLMLKLSYKKGSDFIISSNLINCLKKAQQEETWWIKK